MYVIAEGIIFGTCTIGGAVGSHRVFAAWRQVSPEWRALNVARRHLRDGQRRQADAAKEVRIVKDTSSWRQTQIASIKSEYEDAWQDAD